MKRRRNKGERISLFSFQDIMASVIGMLFFVVILMSLSIVSDVSPVTDPSAGNGATDLSVLRTRAQQLRNDLSALEAQIASTSAKLIQARALDPHATLAELKQMQSNLSALYKTIGREEATLQEMRARAEPKRRDIEDKRA